VDPKAYAPLARSIAERGHEVVIVKLPMRLAPFEFQKEEAVERGRSWIESHPGRWVAAGHSLGGVISCRLAAAYGDLLAGLVLIGTSHPVVLDLSQVAFPVTKVYATNDGLATVEKVEATRRHLPPHTRWVRIEGGNHGQFGWYGRQLHDRPATISREEQQARTIEALLDVLR
jgi:pimeloyl-ACP methyl ester carboxylesterase